MSSSAGGGYFVGSYATQPSVYTVEAERSYFESLRALGPAVGGLELPLLAGGAIHSADEGAVLSALRESPGWRVLLTLVPATMVALKADAHFGLASENTRGRAAAVELARAAAAAVARINAAAGRRAVVAVELHSAPTLHLPPPTASINTSAGGDAAAAAPPASAPRSSVAALTASLVELASWGSSVWGGAELLIEHCDAATAAAPAPVKGFMTIEAEIAAVDAATAVIAAATGDSPPASSIEPVRLGLCVNWARSVLETHDAATPLAHIRAAGRRLRALMFSGCAGVPTRYGAPWLDAHLPHAAAEPASMLTDAAVRECLAASRVEGVSGADEMHPLLALGCKLTLQPPEATPEERAGVNGAFLALLAEAQRSVAAAANADREGAGSAD